MPLEYALQFRGKNPDPGPWKQARSFVVKPTAPLGISDLPVQRQRRSKHRPYLFNVLVAGESGLGKTTLMNSLFNSDLDEPSTRHDPTTLLRPTTYELEEEGVALHLTIVDTPGFGNSLNRENTFKPVIEYIEKQYDNYLEYILKSNLFFSQEHSKEMRKNIRDSRIHALVYLLSPGPNGYFIFLIFSSLKQLDIDFLQRVCAKVNVIPVIAKADSLTPEEMAAFKRAVLADCERHDIRVFPSSSLDNSSNYDAQMPFSVIGSDTLIKLQDGSRVRGRSYRWGSVQVENPAHSDFLALRAMMIQTHMQDLIETTHTEHYSSYRSTRIKQKGRPDSFLACDEYYDSRIGEAKRGLAAELQARENEMRGMFVGKVREKEASLREREERLNEKRKAMMQELEQLRRQVEVQEAAVSELVAARKKRPM